MGVRGLRCLSSADASHSSRSCSTFRYPPRPCTPPRSATAAAEGLIQFLVHQKSFNEQRVRNAVDRINAAKSKSAQGRLESFFGPAKIVSSTVGKRKDEAGAAGGGGKKAKGPAGAPAMKKGKLGGMKKKN